MRAVHLLLAASVGAAEPSSLAAAWNVLRHGRHLQSIDTLVSGLTSMQDATSFADALARMQGIVCSGDGSVKASVQASLGSLESLAPSLFPADMLDATGAMTVPVGRSTIKTPPLFPLIKRAFACSCSTSWDLSDPEYAPAYTRLWWTEGLSSLMSGDAPEGATSDLKTIAPSLLSASNLCSSGCQATLYHFITVGLEMANARVVARGSGSGDGPWTQPMIKSFARSSIECACNDDLPWAPLIEALDQQNTSDTLEMLAPVVRGSLCNGRCSKALREGMVIGGLASLTLNELPHAGVAAVETAATSAVGCLCAPSSS